MEGNAFSREPPGDGSPGAVEVAQAQAPESIGRVEVAKGEVSITRVDGTTLKAAVGTPIFQGDTVETDAEGSIGIVFADDSTFSLAENGRMVIDEMVYDPAAQEGRSAVSVAQGVFSFVSGEIAKTGIDAMTVQTPTATIGIRGTAGGGRAGENGDIFSLFQDLLTGETGEMTITTQVGQVLLSVANQTTQIASPYSLPSAPVVLPAQAVERFFSSAVETLRTTVGAPPRGPTDQGDDAGTDTTQNAAQAAAGAAFDQALAQGLSLEEAMNAAMDTAGQVVAEGLLALGPAPVEEQFAVVVAELVEVARSLEGPAPDGDGGEGDGDIDGDGLPPPPPPLTTGPPPPPDDDDDEEDEIVQDTTTTPDNEVSIAGTVTFTLTSANDVITGSAGDDILTLVGQAQSGDSFDGRGSDDSIFLDASGSLANTISLTSVAFIHGSANPDTVTATGDFQEVSGSGGDDVFTLTGTASLFGVNGGAGNDTINVSGTFSEVNGGADTDTVTTLAAGATINRLQSVEFLTGGAGNDAVTLASGTQGLTVDLGGGNDTLTFSGSFGFINSVTVSNAETINGNSSDDSVTLGAAQVGGTFDLAGGSDSLTLAAGTNTLTVSNSESITGNTGVDTLTIQGSSGVSILATAGADSYALNSSPGTHTVRYTATTAFGDTLTGFAAGAGGDVIDFDVTVSNGLANEFQSLASDGTLGTNTAVAVITTAVTDFQTASSVATALNGLLGLSAGDKLLLSVGDGANGNQLYYWANGTNGGADDTQIQAAELSAVAELSGVDNANLTDANFSGFSAPAA